MTTFHGTTAYWAALRWAGGGIETITASGASLVSVRKGATIAASVLDSSPYGPDLIWIAFDAQPTAITTDSENIGGSSRELGFVFPNDGQYLRVLQGDTSHGRIDRVFSYDLDGSTGSLQV